LLGGAEPAAAERFGEFGRALGLGFQVRDDLLGIWGETATTGKAPADDIRRRKQSLPIVLLRERSDAALRAELDRLYQQTEIDQAGVERVLALLHATDIQHTIERRIAALHDEARLALTSALPGSINQAGDRLFALVEQMASRAS
jgi:geranylgeranyl diphosphate synthase type I